MEKREHLYVKTFRYFEKYGFRETLKRSIEVIHRDTIERFEGWKFDRQIGVDTGGLIYYPSYSKNILHRLANHYEATTPTQFRKIMRSVGCMTAPFTFFDMGCGKGRVLLMAAQYSFRKIVGIEFDPTLAQIANVNIDHFSEHNNVSDKISVVCDDAAKYQFPDENAVIFFYNPFKPEIMNKVLENIRLSAKAAKYRYIIYSNPVFDTLLNDPLQFSLLIKERKYSIYRMLIQ